MGEWEFRRGFGTFEFMFRTITLAILWIVCYFVNAKSPEGKADREWLLTFSLLMIIGVSIVHMLAYFPSPPITCSRVGTASALAYNHARTNFEHYHWCGLFVALIVVLYPIILFLSLFTQGFNPYAHLSTPERAIKEGINEKMFWLLRFGLHCALLALICYMIILTGTYYYIKWM